MPLYIFLFFFFNDTATPEIYTLSLHDALPISASSRSFREAPYRLCYGYSPPNRCSSRTGLSRSRRSEEHTSELQSHSDLVCRLLLEKKNHKRFPLLVRRLIRGTLNALPVSSAA